MTASSVRLPARLLPYAQYFIPSIWIKIKMNGDQHQITRAFSRTGKGVTYGWRFGPVTGHPSLASTCVRWVTWVSLDGWMGHAMEGAASEAASVIVRFTSRVRHLAR
ncbi:hypothetical protein GW17_00008575 [Ensete ventricosum]|nr:hypothetical protein GW17_00008575 [Ensete ventricosum]